MLDKTLAARYANALYMAARAAGTAEPLLADLGTVLTVMAEIPALKKIFYHPAITPAQKSDLAQRAFQGSIGDMALRFLELLFIAKRINYLDLARALFLERFNKDSNKAEVTVTSSSMLAPELLEKVRATLRSVLKKEIDMKTEIDGRILGGIRINVGGDVIDGSVSYQLKRMSEKMLAG